MTRGSLDSYQPEETGALIFSLCGSGTVVSVFDKAVNIRVLDRLLVSVIRHAAAMTPMSIHCPALVKRKERRLRIGQAVEFKNGMLVADGWRIEIKGSQRFAGLPMVAKRPGFDAPMPGFDVPMPGFDVPRIDLFEKILHFCGRKEGLLGVIRSAESQNPFVRKGRQIVEKIMSQNRPHLAANLAEFTGLGPGFTPSGDDLICGFLMGEIVADQKNLLSPDASPSRRHPMLDKKEKATLWRAAKGTSVGGRTLIWMALKGRFPKFLCTAGAELYRAGTAKDMLSLVTKATQFGHTSGTDALTGLLLHLRTRYTLTKQNGLLKNEPTDANRKQVSFSGK